VVVQEKTNTEARFDQVNAKIVALGNKFAETPSRAVAATEPRSLSTNPPSPSAVSQNDTVYNQIRDDNQGTTNGNHDGPGRPANSNSVCMSAILSESSMNAPVVNAPVSSFLSNSELPLPLFDDASDTNPVFHLKRLDEFIRLKGIPEAYQLPVADRTMVGQLCRQWAETASRNLSNCKSFKKAFLNTFSSTTRQSLVRCNLYQGKYYRNSNLTFVMKPQLRHIKSNNYNK
jgi:hypothetical protein